jgi:hypothetical protein
MYPFERFNMDAKRSLTLAQEEAERAHHSYIGTEHLLVGLMRVEEGTAYRVLTKIGVSVDQIRKMIDSVLGRSERAVIQTIIPTSRVKKVIEIAFEEARKMNDRDVDTGHMLMALVIEGEGIAAHVLEDLGATHELVITGVQRELGAPITPRPRLQEHQIVTDPSWIIGRPALRTPVQDLMRLLESPPIAKQLKARGLDTDALLKQLNEPPAKVNLLRKTLIEAQSALETAVRAQQVELAARLQHTVDSLLEELMKAEQEWLDALL